MERRSLMLLDATVPLIVCAVILGASALEGPGQSNVVALGLELGAALVLTARRHAPLLTLAASAALVAVALHLDTRVGPIAVLAPAVALFSIALTRDRLQQALGAVVAICLVVVADVAHGGEPGVIVTLGHVALVSVPLLAAEALRTRRANVALLVQRLELAEHSREQETQQRIQQERMRIAREMHDIVAHTLTVINVQAATAVHLIDTDPGFTRTALETIDEASREATAELRAILGVLRDRDDLAAPYTPAPSIENIADLVQRARDAGLDARLEVTGDRDRQALDTVSLAAYRIVQESLTNVHKHAAGAPVRVRLGYEPDRVSVSVQNGARTSRGPGTGAKEPAGDGSGVGIRGMAERAEALGGTLRATPLPAGFRIDANLPYSMGAE